MLEPRVVETRDPLTRSWPANEICAQRLACERGLLAGSTALDGPRTFEVLSRFALSGS